jgi:hypothetical protein
VCEQGDMLVFLSIILLLGIGYGVAMYTLIFPERNWDDITIAKVFYRYVFRVFPMPARESVIDCSIDLRSTFLARLS